MPFKLNPFSGSLDVVNTSGGGVSSWKTTVANAAALPSMGNSDGDVRVTLDTEEAYIWNGSAWIYLNDVHIGAFSGTPTATGLTVNSATNTINLDPADATHPGGLSTGAQAIGGSKTFGSVQYTDGGIDTSTASTLSIGVTNATIINLGNASATINFNGTVNNNNVTNLNVTDQLITLNDGGGAGSGSGSGFEIEEAGSPTGYVKSSGDRNSFSIKAPNTAGIATITPGASGLTIDGTEVKGPGSATDNTLPRFDSTTGKLIQGSGITVTDTNDITIPGSTTLATSLTGPLHASSGVVSASAISLTADVSGVLPVANGGTALSSTPSNGQLLIGNGTNYTLAGIIGTSNQVTVTNGVGTVTLSTPQSIGTGSSPTFAGLTVGSLTGPVRASSGVLSTGNTDLSSEVTGNLSTSHLNSGTSASASTFWRGDGTWSSVTPTANYATDATTILSSQGLRGLDSGAASKFLAGYVDATTLSSWDALPADTAMFQNELMGSPAALYSQGSQAADTTNTTGVVQISSGSVINTSSVGSSGIVYVQSGMAAGSGSTGYVQLLTGPIPNATNTATTGSFIFNTGYHLGLGDTGGLTATTGNTTLGGATGTISLATGFSFGTSGSTGNITSTTGDISDIANAANTGSVNIVTGNTAGTGNSGAINLTTGTGTVRGAIALNGGAVSISSTSLTTGTITSGTWNGSLIDLAHGGTNKNMTASAGAVAYSDADSLELTAVGTSGQFLKSNGASAPSWANVTVASAGDIAETSFSTANNVAATNVTGFAFANGTVRSFSAMASVYIDATSDLFEAFELQGVQRGSDWILNYSSVGDSSGITFSITTAGQIQYASTNISGFVSGTMKFRAQTLSV